MRPTHAIVLFAHGARNVHWAQPLEGLKATLAHLRPGSRIQIAFLEMLEPNLAASLEALATEGVLRIDIAPVFWSRGAHVNEDLPAIVTQFTARHPGIHVQVLPVLAELPGIHEFLAHAILLFSPEET